jgi:hypothetical protein
MTETVQHTNKEHAIKSPAITRKGYQVIARALGCAIAEDHMQAEFSDPSDPIVLSAMSDVLETTIGCFEAALKADNPRFDAERFNAAILSEAQKAQKERLDEDEQQELEEIDRNIGP